MNAIVDTRRPTPAQQLRTLEYALKTDGWIHDFSVAIDGGANTGLWTALMAERFGHVHAVEPSAELYAHLASLFSAERVTVHHAALMARPGRVSMVYQEKKPGHRSGYVESSDSGDVRAITIDGLNLDRCGLIKLDVEGAETDALHGAFDTLRRCRPVVIVEVDRHLKRFGSRRADLRRYLEKRRYTSVLWNDPDEIFVPRERAAC